MCRFFIVLYLLARLRIIGASNCDHGYDKYYSSKGDVRLVGLFDAHRDANCSVPNMIVLQQMYNIAVAIKLLNDIDYVPGLTIGMSLYDTCDTNDTTQKALVSIMANPNCSTPYNLGIFSSNYASQIIGNVSATYDVPVYTLNYTPKIDVLMKISVELLRELKYNTVDLAVFPSQDLMLQFYSMTVAQNICVKESYTFAEYNGTCPGHELLIIIAVTSAELSPLLKLEVNCMSTFVIIILDNNVDLSSVTDHLFLHEAFIIISSNIWPEFAITVDDDDFQTIITTIQENLHYSNVTMDFIRTASAVISIVDHMKGKLSRECGCKNVFSLCANLTQPRKSDELIMQNESTFSVPQVLGIQKKNIVQYLILKSHYNVMDNYGEIRIVENDVHIEFVNPVFPKEATECDPTVDSCQNCSNFIGLNETIVRTVECPEKAPFILKSNNWVFSILTVCIIGIISCVCVLTFIAFRVCKRDILEGNPSSTFLLIAATILTYVAVFPFCVLSINHKILCVLKLFGTSISYCFIFSVILSRVVMILTCDYNGSFMSHINGYLQSFLCFFMFAVQFGLVLEFWIFGWLLSNVDFCVKLESNYFMAYLLYDVFLLMLIVSVVPFVTHSRRNYREGLCFTVLSACFAVIWICWTFSYFVVNDGSKDFFVAFGLTATASSVVVCILIPRTYLIVTGIVRDQITSAIPSNISNLVDVNYRSTQALYDSVKIDMVKRGELNAGYYEDPHSVVEARCEVFETRRPSADVDLHEQEDEYENCSVSHTNQKITKF